MFLRKILVSLAVILLLAYCLAPYTTKAQSGDTEFDLALQWMYEQGMTKYNDADSYGAKSWLTREQGAKFFAVFMEDVLDQHDEAEGTSCVFDDEKKMDTTLVDHIGRACELGLFKGSKGNFFPRDPLTKAQALTVLVRALEGNQAENVQPRWNNYFNRARWLGLTKEIDVRALDRPITRYEMALLLYRSVHDDYDPDLADLQELEALLLALGLRTK